MKMHDVQLVIDQCMTMIKDLEGLKKLELNMQRELKVDLILQFLISLFGQFIVNYHMNKLDCNLSKLINMLVTTEGTLKSSRGSVLAIKQACDALAQSALTHFTPTPTSTDFKAAN